MATTKTLTELVYDILNEANPNRVINALRLMKLGNMFTPRKVTFAALAAAAAHNITDAAHFAAATVVPAYPSTGPSAKLLLPAILAIISLRVTAGAAQPGARVPIDSGGAPAASATGIGGAPGGTAALSDDGTTITFEANVTAFVLEYIPRSDVDLTLVWEAISGNP